MFRTAALTALALLAVAQAQLVGNNVAESHPRISVQTCTSSGCTTKQASVVLDSNWRWVHVKGGYTNCYSGSQWNSSVCSDPKTCAQNCELEGAEYSSTYGITTSGNALTLKFITSNTNGKNIGSRVYLMDTDERYQMFNLLNQEFTFDVDMSKLPCGLNGAVYFVEMDADGGMSKYSTNKAGAKYGTGYCDAQCPHDIKFINGEANVIDWTPSETDANAGFGKWGTCCNEMDIWEANSMATAYTPHTCSHFGQARCDNPADCGDGDQRYSSVCDKDGCDFNSFRMGDKQFLGPGKTVDTTKKVTVVTQFLTNNQQASGDLVEIRRLYVQDGKVIHNSKTNIPGMSAYDSITDQFCIDQKKAFSDNNAFIQLGGHKAMGQAFKNGMVLALSIWADHAAHMLWLDSDYPLDRPASQPGVSRGTCPQSSGDPADLETSAADAVVTYSNLKWGPIGSTYSGTGSTTTTGGSGGPTTTTTANSAVQTRWGQCGGNGWTGPTTCVAGTTCVVVSGPWYSQCQ